MLCDTAELIVGSALAEPLDFAPVHRAADCARRDFARTVAKNFDQLCALKRDGLLYVTASKRKNIKRTYMRNRYYAIEEILQETSATWWLARQHCSAETLIAEKIAEYQAGAEQVSSDLLCVDA